VIDRFSYTNKTRDGFTRRMLFLAIETKWRESPAD